MRDTLKNINIYTPSQSFSLARLFKANHSYTFNHSLPKQKHHLRRILERVPNTIPTCTTVFLCHFDQEMSLIFCRQIS